MSQTVDVLIRLVGEEKAIGVLHAMRTYGPDGAALKAAERHCDWPAFKNGWNAALNALIKEAQEVHAIVNGTSADKR